MFTLCQDSLVVEVDRKSTITIASLSVQNKLIFTTLLEKKTTIFFLKKKSFSYSIDIKLLTIVEAINYIND